MREAKGDNHMSQERVRPSRPGLVLELSALYDRSGVLLVQSIPGREGTFTRTWKSRDGSLLDADTSRDIAAFVEKCVLDFMYVHVGVQGVL